MEKDITRFRGCLKDIYKGKMDKELIDFMLDINLITKINDYYIEIKGKKYNSRDHLISPISFDNESYLLNDDMFLDMYEIIEDNLECEDYYYDLKQATRNINRNLTALFDKKKKTKFLKKAYKQKIMSIEFIDDFNMYVQHKTTQDFDKKISKQNLTSWQSNIIGELHTDHLNIVKYLIYTGLKNNYIDLNPIGKLCQKWTFYSCSKAIIDKINTELEKLDIELENKSSNKTLENSTQKIILLNKIINSKKWQELSPNKKSLILKPILGCHERTIRKSLNFVNNKHSATKSDIVDDYEQVNAYLINLGINLGDPTN